MVAEEGLGPGAVAAVREEARAQGFYAGQMEILNWLVQACNLEIATAEKYADTRYVESIRKQAEDKIREVHSE